MTTSTRSSTPLFTTITLALVASLVSAQNPPCYLCGGDENAVFLLPETVIPVDDTNSVTCGQVFDFAIQGAFDETDCAEASASTELGILCGCSNLDDATVPPDTTPAPVAAPVAAPVVTPTAVPVAVAVPTPPVDVPVTPVDVPVTPVEVPITPVASAPKGKKGKMTVPPKEKKGMMTVPPTGKKGTMMNEKTKGKEKGKERTK